MALKSIPNSLVFDHNDPDFLSRTFVAGDDATTWTLSFWVKLGEPAQIQSETILSAGTDINNNTTIFLGTNGHVGFRYEVGGTTIDSVGPQIFFLADPTVWYHIVITYDTNEGAASDRIKIWSNNRRLTEFNPSNFPLLAATSHINTAVEHRIGSEIGNTFGDNRGYLADVYFIDGTALTPSSFGELVQDSWQPIVASPTFGTNGWFLEFGTAAALGDDTSGNTNDWTQNSITTANQREDSPSQNHVTLNPWRIGKGGFPDAEVHFGNRQLIAESSNIVTSWATAALPKTGKYYWEVDCVLIANAAECTVGVVDQLADPQLVGRVWQDNHGWALRNSSGTQLQVMHDLAALSTFTDTGTMQTGDYVMVAYDTATRNLWFGINGTWLDSGNPGAGTNPAITFTATEVFGDQLIPAIEVSGTTGNILQFRAGTEDLEASVPSGFVTLRVDAWPVPAITKPSAHFDYITWDGDNTSPRTIGGANFQPDLAWVKRIAGVGNHLISDTIKGAGTVHYNNAPTVADAAASIRGEISAFNADGIDVQDGATDGRDVNQTGGEFVALLWRESALAGFDLVGYTGAAAPQNIAHALGVAPDFMYVRNRDAASDNEVYFGKTIDGTAEQIPDPETDSVQANTTAALTDSLAPWDDTAPDASNFRVGSDTATNVNTQDHQAYLWAEVEGFSKIGGYIGGATNNPTPFVYCGFRPKMVLIKRLDAVQNWALLIKEGDNTNFGANYEPFQQAWQFWPSNTDAADISPGNPALIICGSGFAIRETDPEFNAVGEYAFIAFAEVPFQLTTAGIPEGPTADGAVDLGIEIDGAASNPTKHGAGAVDVAFEIAATGDDPHQHSDGAVDLSFLLTGAGTNPRHNADGVPDLGFVIDGQGSVPPAPGAGTPNLKLEIDGTGTTFGINADGATDLLLILDGLGFNTAIRGSPTLPQLATVGQVEQSTDMFGNSTLPLLQMGAVTILNAIPIFGDPKLPLLRTEGEINPDFDVDLPILQTFGTIISGAVLRTSVPGLFLPQLRPNGTLLNPGLTVGNALLPLLRITGSIQGGAVITAPGVDILGASTLPALEVNGFLLIPQEMAGTVILPALDLDPLSFLAPGAIVTGSVTLPLLRLESILVNGVTLAATVWSMNTETLETTNYLNFGFDSLVNFADQPYGVTPAGIFLLEGADDDGTNIDARILTGISDRGDENLKVAAHLYLQGEFKSLVLQLLPDGQQRVREYRVERRSNASGVIHARAKGAKGLRSRSWQMGFRNLSGGDFTLDKLGLLLRQLTRKTRKN